MNTRTRVIIIIIALIVLAIITYYVYKSIKKEQVTTTTTQVQTGGLAEIIGAIVGPWWAKIWKDKDKDNSGD